MAAYLEACLQEANGDAAFIAKILVDIDRARGILKVARDAGLSGLQTAVMIVLPATIRSTDSHCPLCTVLYFMDQKDD